MENKPFDWTKGGPKTLYPSINEQDYAAIPKALIEIADDCSDLKEWKDGKYIFDMLAFICRTARTEDDQLNRLQAMVDLPEAVKSIEFGNLENEYASGTDRIALAKLLHQRINKEAPFPAISTIQDAIILTEDMTDPYSGTVRMKDDSGQLFLITPELSALIIDKTIGKDAVFKGQKRDIDFHIKMEADNPSDMEIIIGAAKEMNALLSAPTENWFLIGRPKGYLHIVSDSQSKSLEQSRKRPEMLNSYWNKVKDGEGLQIASHHPDYLAWITPSPDGVGNVIIATNEQNPRPVASESDMFLNLRERYVDPEFRGKGLGSMLVTIRERNPLISRTITGSGIFSIGGYKSRKSAYKAMIPSWDAVKTQALTVDNPQKPDQKISEAAPKPTPFSF